MNIERKERGQYPDGAGGLPADALPCTATTRPASPIAGGAVYKREDGLVIIDPEKAKGHPEIVGSCPYERHLLERRERRSPRSAPAAPICIDEGWTETRCSQVCPTDAIKLVLADDAEMAARVAAEGLEVLPRRAGHQAAGLLQEPAPLDEGLRRRQRRLRRHRRVRRGRQGDRDRWTARGRRGRRATTTAQFWSTSSSRARTTSSPWRRRLRGRRRARAAGGEPHPGDDRVEKA